MSVFNRPLRLLLGVSLLLSSVLVTSCKKDDNPVTTNTIADIVLTNNSFTLLRAALQRANLTDVLRTGTYTVFAPNDDAFKAAGYADVAAINAIPVANLTGLLQYHVLANRVTAADVPAAQNTPVQSLLTTNGRLYVSKINTTVSVNGRTVRTADVAADNGVVHIINDGLLVPPSGSVVDLVTTSSSAQSFSLLTAAVLRAGLATGLASTTGVTIFAPTNEAFAAEGITAATIATMTPAQLTRVLQYHIVPTIAFSTNLTDGGTLPTLLTGATLRSNVSGTGVTITGAGNATRASTVIPANANILTTTGVVHAINRILLPPP